MSAATLHQRFAWKMLPLALFTSFLVIGIPPLVYHVVALDRLRAQASIYAHHVAKRLRLAALEQPDLWQYNTSKLLQASLLHDNVDDIENISVVRCDGETIFRLHKSRIHPVPHGTAAVEAHGVVRAHVQVSMSTGQERLYLAGICAASGLLGLAVAVLLYGFPTLVVRRQGMALRQSQDALRAANADLNERVAQATLQVRELSHRVVSTQEHERRRISRDLHDGLGQFITAIAVSLQVAQRDGATTPKQLEKAVGLCQEALRELRHVVQQLRPTELESKNLHEALEAYTEGFEERTGIATSLRFKSQQPCPEPVATCIYRLVQEALTNVFRHAGAHEVGIRVDISDHKAQLEILDDGRGFDSAKIPGGLGLRGMRERCELLNGFLHIESGEQGTRLFAVLPTTVEAA